MIKSALYSNLMIRISVSSPNYIYSTLILAITPVFLRMRIVKLLAIKQDAISLEGLPILGLGDFKAQSRR